MEYRWRMVPAARLQLNGALYEGTNANAGEAGHIPLASDGPIGYGKRGSFEGFCSGGGIRQQAIAYAKEQLLRGNAVSYCATEGVLLCSKTEEVLFGES